MCTANFLPPLETNTKMRSENYVDTQKLRGHDSLDKHSQNQHVLIIKDLKGVGFG